MRLMTESEAEGKTDPDRQLKRKNWGRKTT